MGFLDFFKKKQILVSTEDDKIMLNLPEFKKEDFVDESNPLDKGNTIVINYGTGMPIDLIYNDLKEDYEQKGYEDAICNPDMSYKEMNQSIIRHNIEIKFEQVILKYNDDLHDIDFHIESRSQAGLIDVVKQLKTKRETLQRHVDKLHEMEADFRNEVPYMMGVLLSYERGFLRGLAALSLDTLKNK